MDTLLGVQPSSWPVLHTAWSLYQKHPMVKLSAYTHTGIAVVPALLGRVPPLLLGLLV
jgi:hypothetical protein